MQNKCTAKRIFIGETDLNVAYHRIHENTTTVSTIIVILDTLAFLCLSLNFETTPAPAEYTTVSEVEIYLDNDLLQD